MANDGKYCDRNPTLTAAGQRTKISDISPSLRFHSLEDEVQAIIKSLGKLNDTDIERSPRLIRSSTKDKTNNEVNSLLSPPKKRFFQHLREELRETAYKSYWTNELGRVPDQVPGLPLGMDPETTIFGRPTGVYKGKDSVGEDVFQKRPFGETKLEEELGLELYQKSHNHYLVGQRKDRMYEVPTHVTYGKTVTGDQSGRQAKKCLEWFNQDNITRTSQGQSRLRQRKHHELGKPLQPNKILEIVGEEHVFGRKRGVGLSDGVKGGMREGPIDKRKEEMGVYVGYIVKLRKGISRRNPPLPFFSLINNLKLLDQGGCSCLPLRLVYDVCARFGLVFDKNMLEKILNHLGIIHGEDNDSVSYYAFCNILNAKEPLPEFKNVSAYRKAAGIASLRTDRSRPGNVGNDERILLGDETSVDACIRPSIFSFYGLNHRDFFQPRSKEYMRDLWKRVGLEIPDNIYEEMWKEGVTRIENSGNMVCIETFRNMLDEMCAAKLSEVRNA